MTGKQSSAELLWKIRPIRESSEELLSRLDRKELYLPVLEEMRVENRKQEWLSVRLMLKEILGEEKEIGYTREGKPYLTDDSYHISISHTRGYVALILDKNHPVGIDIEYISPRIQKVRSRFMNEEEELYLSGEHENIHLLLHWSAKESLFKAMGEEDVEFKEQLHIRPFDPVFDTLSSFPAYETRTEKRNSYIIHYFIHADYVLTFTRNQ